MFVNEKAVSALVERSKKLNHSSTSSHWKEMLDGFTFEKNKFSGKGLPEGEGGIDRTFFHTVIHYVLQHPYRLMGYRFPTFESIVADAKAIHSLRGNKMRLGTLRQAISLACIDNTLEILTLEGHCLVIGDGFGLFSSLIKRKQSNASRAIIIINLTQNLLSDIWYVRKSFPDSRCVLIDSTQDVANCQSHDDFIFIEAQNYSLIKEFDLSIAFNMVSFQEMTLGVIDSYFQVMRESKGSQTYLYCANRVEKTLPDGEITRFSEYPWAEGDRIFFDELCPWMQKYYSAKPPFYHNYDGPIQHRLIQLEKYPY
tara:strand:- start:233 stop:1168 length:936 start_codon:yes stop_codon:yes gene_type:complete